jgi:hypothetical protein
LIAAFFKVLATPQEKTVAHWTLTSALWISSGSDLLHGGNG